MNAITVSDVIAIFPPRALNYATRMLSPQADLITADFSCPITPNNRFLDFYDGEKSFENRTLWTKYMLQKKLELDARGDINTNTKMTKSNDYIDLSNSEFDVVPKTIEIPNIHGYLNSVIMSTSAGSIAAKTVRKWLTSWVEYRNLQTSTQPIINPPVKKRKSKYYRSGDSESELSEEELNLSEIPTSILILKGSSGCGKSALIHTLADDLKFTVIEVNAGQIRSGKCVKSLVHEAAQSHNIKLGQQSSANVSVVMNLILFDEVRIY